MPRKIFISYAHEDAAFLTPLRAHLAILQRTRKDMVWDDRQIPVGSGWHPSIFDQLKAADVIILLISADYINSTFCMDHNIGRC